MSCSACRASIGFRQKYWQCSVSTCNRPRTRLVFCSINCWDSHVATLRHRDAGAIDAISPSREQWASETASEAPKPAAEKPVAAAPAEARRRVVDPPAETRDGDEGDVLIVVSKMKKYIRDRSGMSTADAVAERLSDHVRALCDEAIRAARAHERKTVLDRDVPPRR